MINTNNIKTPLSTICPKMQDLKIENPVCSVYICLGIHLEGTARCKYLELAYFEDDGAETYYCNYSEDKTEYETR